MHVHVICLMMLKAYFNPYAYRYCLDDKQIHELTNELQLSVIKKSSLKVLLQVDLLSFEEHYENILNLLQNRTSVGLDNRKSRTSMGFTEGEINSENRTSVGLYDNIFNDYRFNNIQRGLMSTDVPFLELLILKNIYPYRLDYTTHIDERYFKNNTQEPISTADIHGLDGLDYCEVVLTKGTS